MTTNEPTTEENWDNEGGSVMTTNEPTTEELARLLEHYIVTDTGKLAATRLREQAATIAELERILDEAREYGDL